MSRKRSNRPDTAGRRRGVAQRVAAQAQSDGVVEAAPPVVGFVSLGCAKNLVDSERMLAQIAESGAALTGDESLADTIVVNTCGFLGAAREEALGVIRELVVRKRRGDLQRIVVAGCLVQRDGQKLLEAIPEIDALVGVHNRDDVPAAVWGARLPGARDTDGRASSRPDTSLHLGDYHPQPWTDQGRLRLTPKHYAYVRISEGCNQKCTFCTIPSIRGPMHCKPPDALVAECRELIADGARELLLIGQDTTSYGLDLGYDAGLAGLLRHLDAHCEGADWIRLMYVYPSVLTTEMIDAIAACERVVKYIDIPLQHINDRMLRAMGRRVTRQQTEQLLEQLRTRIPGVTIRTTFIVGFPGETEAEFAELVDFVRGFGFDAVGAFKYSFEAETPSARIAGHLEDELKQDRYERLMLAQQQTTFAAARRWIGRSFDVVIDEVGTDGIGAGHTGGEATATGRTFQYAGPGDAVDAVARHPGQAPEVDAVCLVRETGAGLQPGAVVAVRCTETRGYDLVVTPVRRKLPVA